MTAFSERKQGKGRKLNDYDVDGLEASRCMVPIYLIGDDGVRRRLDPATIPFITLFAGTL